jgi:hypothetical protein
MSIPDKAVEAAARRYYQQHWKALRSFDKSGDLRPDVEWEDLPAHSRVAFGDIVRPQVEAAAPFMGAEILRRTADQAEKRSPDDGVSPHWLRQVADVVEAAG